MPFDNWNMPTWPVNNKAVDICYDAMDLIRSNPEEALRLARLAKSMAPVTCIEAYYCEGAALTEIDPPQNERAMQLYNDGIRIAHGLHPEWATDAAIEWGILANRPYMRLLHGKLLLLLDIEHYEEALTLARRMIAMNERDNQGIRTIIIQLAGKTGDTDTMKWIVDKFLFFSEAKELTNDPGILYTYALIGYLDGVLEVEQRRRLAMALASNFHIARFLLHPEEVPIADCDHDYITSGGEDEAIQYVEHCGVAWNARNALEWLSRCEAAPIPSEARLIAELERNKRLLVRFRKTDGTLRLMLATRVLEYVPIPKQPNNGIHPHESGQAIHVYDFNANSDHDGRKGGWRSFKYDTVIATPFFDVIVGGGIDGSSLLPVGSTVCVHSLSQNTSLNGKEGIIIGPYESFTTDFTYVDRFPVRMNDGTNVKVKPRNLKRPY